MQQEKPYPSAHSAKDWGDLVDGIAKQLTNLNRYYSEFPEGKEFADLKKLDKENREQMLRKHDESALVKHLTKLIPKYIIVDTTITKNKKPPEQKQEPTQSRRPSSMLPQWSKPDRGKLKKNNWWHGHAKLFLSELGKINTARDLQVELSTAEGQQKYLNTVLLPLFKKHKLNPSESLTLTPKNRVTFFPKNARTKNQWGNAFGFETWAKYKGRKPEKGKEKTPEQIFFEQIDEVMHMARTHDFTEEKPPKKPEKPPEKPAEKPSAPKKPEAKPGAGRKPVTWPTKKIQYGVQPIIPQHPQKLKEELNKWVQNQGGLKFPEFRNMLAKRGVTDPDEQVKYLELLHSTTRAKHSQQKWRQFLAEPFMDQDVIRNLMELGAEYRVFAYKFASYGVSRQLLHPTFLRRVLIEEPYNSMYMDIVKATELRKKNGKASNAPTKTTDSGLPRNTTDPSSRNTHARARPAGTKEALPEESTREAQT